ncbi:class I SAM-dependent methyltransferase [Polymorphospora sp. NPDC050346]|uniref:class I SAM-dependent methyltransferase n=1 Tax=Polymorphospora sp. NPDC050346 TaxID=3155780 RepID=UPI0033D66FA6
MTTTAANTAAWQAHAKQRLADTAPQARTPPARMQWTQHPNTGPGAELLGDLAGQLVVELGCGPAHNLAHLVHHHQAVGIGVDAARAQIHRAKVLYGHLDGLTLLTADATEFLTTTKRTFDVVYCAFGALGLSPPDPILAGIRQRLHAGGRLGFSVPHIRSDNPPGPIADTLALPDGQHRPITRWIPSPAGWTDLLTRHGFTVDDQQFLPPTTRPGCLIMTAHPT